MQYPTKEGESMALTRYRLTLQGDALRARSRIDATVLRHAVLGIAAGKISDLRKRWIPT